MREQIVLIRGLVRHHRHWRGLDQTLRSYPYHFDVHFLDLPGNGKYFDVPTPLDMPSIAKFIERDFFTSIYNRDPDATKKKWHILALSLGAMATLEWSTQGPGKNFPFQTMTLINTSSRRDNTFWQRFPFRLLPKLVFLFMNYSPLQVEETIIEATTSAPEKYRAAVDEGLALQKDYPIHRTQFLRQLIAGARFSAPDRLPIRTLFMRSLKDQLVNPLCSKRLAFFYDAPLRDHPWAGHDLPLEDPLWLCSHLLEFIRPNHLLRDETLKH